LPGVNDFNTITCSPTVILTMPKSAAYQMLVFSGRLLC
jgi:hypothetical protein